MSPSIHKETILRSRDFRHATEPGVPCTNGGMTTTVKEQPRKTEVERRYATPTGDPCPYALRTDGTVDGDGDCRGCGTCLLGAGWSR
nr:hypothetical protein Ade03nite_83670 [Actinoplanes derwentensis]